MSNAFSLRCIYLSCKVLYFILSDDDFEIKSKIYSFNLRLVLKHILHSQNVFFRNLLFTLLFSFSLELYIYIFGRRREFCQPFSEGVKRGVVDHVSQWEKAV